MSPSGTARGRFHANDERRFDYRGDTYTTEWPLADEKGWKFFRLLEGTLATDVVKRAKDRKFDAASCLRFDLSAYRGGRLTDVEPLRGKAGWARLAKLHIKTPAVTREHLVIAAVADDGDPSIPKPLSACSGFRRRTSRLHGVPPEADLQSREAVRRKELLDEAEQQNAEWLDVESENLDHYAEDLERAFETEIKTVEAEIRKPKRPCAALPFRWPRRSPRSAASALWKASATS
jgi:hypothetical protein